MDSCSTPLCKKFEREKNKDTISEDFFIHAKLSEHFHRDRWCSYYAWPRCTVDRATVQEHEKEEDKSEDILEELNETQCHLCKVNLPTRDDLIENYDLAHIKIYTLMTSRSTTTR